jgi:hypothetical protein
MDKEAMPALKTVIWVGSSRRDLHVFPEPVKGHMGYARSIAQREIEDWTRDGAPGPGGW